VTVATAAGGLTAEQVHIALGSVSPDNGVVVSEFKNGGAVMWDRVSFGEPGSYYFAAAGGLGFGLPAAVGAQLAHPECSVVAIPAMVGRSAASRRSTPQPPTGSRSHS
jgi:benzoylformate decarboxylase